MLSAFELYDYLKEFGEPSIVEKMILKRICEKQSSRVWNGAESFRTGTASVEY
jgi:hypothetical protein